MLRPRLAGLLAIIAAMAMLGAAAPLAGATTFTVDSIGDEDDGTLNDNVCDSTAAGVDCTLRAAIREVEDAGSPGADTINFTLPVLSEIQLGSVLPSINEQVAISGCSADPNHAGPCVGVRGSGPGTDGLLVQGPDVTVSGLAITNSFTAINGLAGSSSMTVANNWLGIDIDEDDDPNTTGVQLTEPDAVIGGTSGATGASPADRNVFANSSEGLSVAGLADDAQIQGNYFGVTKGGDAEAANGDNIVLGGNASNQPSNTLIGGTQPIPGTCSGPCNVISGANTDGIDLQGAFTDAAESTTISGNFIGLNAAGDAAIENTTGIRTVNAPDTTIGGPAAGERNYITGGSQAISSQFGGAPNLSIENNFIGTNVAGTAALFPPGASGASVVSIASLDDAGVSIVDNVIAEDPSATEALNLIGNDAIVDGNLIGVGPAGQDLGGGQGGIRAVKLHDSTISDNTIGNFTVRGLTFEGSTGNTATGNLVGTDSGGNDQGGGATGIWVTNFVDDASTGNTIGGDLTADENVVSNMSDDAIEVETQPDSAPNTTQNFDNEIARNRGANNGSGVDDLFIELRDAVNGVGEGPGNSGANAPNNGVQAPTVTLAGGGNAGGTAEVGSTVRVFSKATSIPGEVEGFLGSATTAGDGSWAVTYLAPVADGTRIVATQTDGSDTSELSSFVVTDGLAPDTQITSGPTGATTDTTPTFAFTSDVGAALQCRLDGGAFAPCNSPVTTAALPDGSHTFQVRGVDASLNADPTPASRSFTVDTLAPSTTITKAPRKRLTSKRRKRRVTFNFTSSEPGKGGFQCQIDNQAFVLCASPFARKLKRGKHTFRVRAFDAAGNADPSLEVRTFRIVKPKRKRR